MTYEKFAEAVAKNTGLDRKAIAKTARQLIIILLSFSILLGSLVSSVFNAVSMWFAGVIIFIVLMFSMFTFLAEEAEVFTKAQKIAKLYPIAIVLMIAGLLAIKLLI